MKNTSTGTGLAIVAAAALAYPFISSLAPNANASAVTAAVAAVSTAATAQTGPTIIWYGMSSGDPYNAILTRAWSDGRIEALAVARQYINCSPSTPTVVPCGSWQVLSTSNQGYNAASDINFDSKVDGSDLAQVLNDWGNAPRHDVPPSTCPLNLINP